MQRHRTSERSPSAKCLDGSILGLLVSREQQRPWSAHEIVRAIGRNVSVLISLESLRRAGLVHRWEDFASATNAAVHFHDITQTRDSDSQHEWDIEHRVLDVLLTASKDGKKWLPEKKVWRVLRARQRRDRLAINDALDRLDGAGLVDSCHYLVKPSDAAIRLDQIMTL
jgi:hypothetical protein